MRRLVKVLILVLLPLAIAYAAWPIYSALEIREAVIAGDTATLNRKVEWEALRASLKASITPETIARLMADPDAPPPTLWQRIKAAVAPTMADSVIERYVTPEHLPVLLGYRRIYRGTVRPALGLKEPPSVLAGTWLDGTAFDRFASFWVRVRRAVFMSPTRFVLEVEDKYRPGRQFVGTLELKGYDWKLTGLSVTGGGGL
jgi:hypothetical protein